MDVQPPSGGCVLKHTHGFTFKMRMFPAAFGRLCVETWALNLRLSKPSIQPPSGGCVLKPTYGEPLDLFYRPAAFGRLCVETRCIACHGFGAAQGQPPSGGCVLKHEQMFM